MSLQLVLPSDYMCVIVIQPTLHLPEHRQEGTEKSSENRFPANEPRHCRLMRLLQLHTFHAWKLCHASHHWVECAPEATDIRAEAWPGTYETRYIVYSGLGFSLNLLPAFC